jgi:protein gp37
MPQKTGIEWADLSSNPLKARAIGGTGRNGWSCAKISPGCAHCYSEAINKRFGTGLDFSAKATREVDHYLHEGELKRLLNYRPKGPFKGTSRPKVFVCDMTDMFGEWVSFHTLATLFGAFALTPEMDFLLLTKRAERMAEFANQVNIRDLLYEGMERAAEIGGIADFMYDDQWPLPNVWLGVSCEDQQRADERIPWLLKTPAAVRFLSCEPLLEAVDLTFIKEKQGGWMVDALRGQWERRHVGGFDEPDEAQNIDGGPRIDWMIAGGESGHGARPCNVEHLRSLVSQCQAAGVSAFVKQAGSLCVDNSGESRCSWPGLTQFKLGEEHCRVLLKDGKGGDPAEWPADLNVREFPKVVRQ